MSESIPQHIAENILVNCARRCCVCRRFRPLLLQVHHIRERSQGGSDDPDNLIATCVSCHAQIHTETKLTRRFTESELKKLRNDVYQLVADGKLPTPQDPEDQIEIITATLIGFLSLPIRNNMSSHAQLLPEAVEILVAATNGNGTINAIQSDSGFTVLASTKQFDFHNDPRKMAALRRSIQQLDQLHLIEGDGELYYVSYDGYELIDNLLSSASLKT